MSTQIVIPTRVGTANTSNSSSNVSTVSTPTLTSNKITTKKFARFRPPPKPEIQVDKNELKKKLTPIQYKVTQEKFTERPFSGEYLRLNERGLYCCIVCGEELFSSETKYDSGCGWPAFYDVIDNKKFILQADLSHVGGNLLLLALNQDLARTEVTCAKCGSHIGHVFDDGPKETGKRYCVNSASLKFIKPNCDDDDDSTECKQLNMLCIRDLNLKQKLIPIKTDEIVEKSCKTNLFENCDDALSNTLSQVKLTDVKSNTNSMANKFFHLKCKNEIPPPNSNNTHTKLNRLASFQNDINNNRTPVIKKYFSVKSRYLDHLDSNKKQSVEKHISKLDEKKVLLETHL